MEPRTITLAGNGLFHAGFVHTLIAMFVTEPLRAIYTAALLWPMDSLDLLRILDGTATVQPSTDKESVTFAFPDFNGSTLPKWIDGNAYATECPEDDDFYNRTSVDPPDGYYSPTDND